MNINRKILSIGALLLIVGIMTAVMGYNPSQILQYIFIAILLSIGVLGFVIGQQAKNNFLRSKYYTGIGFILFALAISLGIWAATLGAFINVLGFFLLVLGIVEFVFALQILTTASPVPWGLLGVKLVISAVTATGAAWILTMAEENTNVALLFSAGLIVVIGLAFILLSRITKTFEQAIDAANN